MTVPTVPRETEEDETNICLEYSCDVVHPGIYHWEYMDEFPPA